MKFIIWTIVWFLLNNIPNIIGMLTMGVKEYSEWYRAFWSADIRGWSALLVLILWIVIYQLFIK